MCIEDDDPTTTTKTNERAALTACHVTVHMRLGFRSEAVGGVSGCSIDSTMVATDLPRRADRSTKRNNSSMTTTTTKKTTLV